MPRVSVWLVRAALGYLALGFTIGALLLANTGVPFAPDLNPRLRAMHVEFLLVGWTIQLVMGVAIWIFPRFRLSVLPYGREWLAWLAFGCVNAGVWLVAVGSLAPSGSGAFLVLAGRLAEIGAAAALMGNLWGRVRPFGLSQI